MKIGEVDLGSARLLAAHSNLVNLTNFHALISYYLVAAEGGESSHPPITRVARLRE